MKVTIYTITSCPYCKSAKEYFKSNNIQFEEKNVEKNREYLEEMSMVSDKFSGVPFTIVEKDGGEKTKLKGFTKEEYDRALGIAGESQADEQSQTAPAEDNPKEGKPDNTDSSVQPQPVQNDQQSSTEDNSLEPVKEADAGEAEAKQKLEKVMNDLNKQADTNSDSQETSVKQPVENPQETQPADTSPTMEEKPQDQADSPPPIPDFPSKSE